jgi:DNA-binding NarL/FixJ family response regulator
MPSKPVRVLLADDHPIVLAGIKALISLATDMEVVGEASNGPDALSMAADLRPDIAVLDMSMPGLNGIIVARRLREAGSRCKIIALTVHQEPAYLRQLLEVGMGGYVLKRSAADDLVRAIRVVHGGGVYFDPAIAGQIVETTMRRSQDVALARTVELSERELDVLRLTALGHSNKAIATELVLGIKTVETYKARAMEKLGFRSRVDVIRYAMDNGWLSGS